MCPGRKGFWLGRVNRDTAIAPVQQKETPQARLAGIRVKIRSGVARDSGAPRQIRTAAPASGERKRGTQLTEIAPAPACLLGSRLTTDALDDPVLASVVAILLPRASDTLLVVIKTSPRAS